MRNSGGGHGTLMTSILRPLASGVLVSRSYASVERSYCAALRENVSGSNAKHSR